MLQPELWLSYGLDFLTFTFNIALVCFSTDILLLLCCANISGNKAGFSLAMMCLPFCFDYPPVLLNKQA